MGRATISENSNLALGLALNIGALIFACGIAYAQLSQHTKDIDSLQTAKEKNDLRIQRMERLQFRMAEKLKVRTDDLGYEGEL